MIIETVGRASTMNTSLKKKRFLPSGLSVIHLVLPAILAIALCICTIETVQAQKPFTPDKQGFVGIKVEDSTSPKGAKVVKVLPNSYADQAGIKPGNIIVSINKTHINSAADFHRATSKLSHDTFIDVGVIQNNTKVTRGVQVANLPGSKQAVSPQDKMSPFKNPPDSAPTLTITELAVSQNIIAPGTVFEIYMDLFAENSQEQSDEIRLTMIYTIKKGGRALTAAKPEKLTLPNGIPISIIRQCRAQKEPGNYEVLIKLEMANVKAEKSVTFVVKK